MIDKQAYPEQPIHIKLYRNRQTIDAHACHKDLRWSAYATTYSADPAIFVQPLQKTYWFVPDVRVPGLQL